jgi:hypothetical protein
LALSEAFLVAAETLYRRTYRIDDLGRNDTGLADIHPINCLPGFQEVLIASLLKHRQATFHPTLELIRDTRHLWCFESDGNLGDQEQHVTKLPFLTRTEPSRDNVVHELATVEIEVQY